MTTQTSRYEQDGLLILLTKMGKKALVTWQGASDARDPSAFLGPVFERLLVEVKGCDVTIDFSALEYMNSSTVSPIVTLLKALNAQGIHAQVLFSNVDWQQTHRRCMLAITRVLPHVKVGTKGG
jgi:hypothetical protein